MTGHNRIPTVSRGFARNDLVAGFIIAMLALAAIWTIFW